jgi:hypothetical protein
MDVIFNHGNDSGYGRTEKAKTVDYFIQKNWIVLADNPEYKPQPGNYIVYITAFGIDQAESWEERYSLDKRLTGRSYWLNVDWNKSIGEDLDAFDSNYLANLLKNVKSDFNESELRDLCFELDIEFDDLPGPSRKDKCRELISLMKRQKRIPEFIQICRNKRPNTQWQD